jgi:methyl-accepting chemotaxis protein
MTLPFGNPRVAMARSRPRISAICLRQVSQTSKDEIDNLIGEFQTLRKKLQTDGDRIQRDITQYAQLSQQVMQLTTIISESVKKLPGAPSISR